MTETTTTNGPWRTVDADEGSSLPTIVDTQGHCLLGIDERTLPGSAVVHRTPVVRSRKLAERIVAALNVTIPAGVDAEQLDDALGVTPSTAVEAHMQGVLRDLVTTSSPGRLDVVFDGPPGPEGGRFVEVEDAEGRSVRAGEWVDRGDGTWALRLHVVAAPPCPVCDASGEEPCGNLYEPDGTPHPLVHSGRRR